MGRGEEFRRRGHGKESISKWGEYWGEGVGIEAIPGTLKEKNVSGFYLPNKTNKTAGRCDLFKSLKVKKVMFFQFFVLKISGCALI